MRHRWACALAALLFAATAAADVITVDEATGRIYSRTRRFLVPYEAADSGPAGIKVVRLYYTADGGHEWLLFGERAEAKGAFEFAAGADGVYGFLVQAVDMAGHVEHKEGLLSGTNPEITVVVDTKPPQIEAIFPRQDMELAPGAHMRVRFRVHDPNLSPDTAVVRIRHADDTEFTLLEGLDVEDGEFFVMGPPLFPGTYTVEVRLCDRAGNEGTATFDFLCTRTPEAMPGRPGPVGRDWLLPINAPPRAKTLCFDIDYKVDDIGGQPPAAVGLWYTTDHGMTWQFYGLDPDVVTPFRFQAPKEGVYGFKLTSTTRSGISEPPPKSGTKPDILTLVDVTYPTLMLDAPRGGESYAGGQVHYIRWWARDDHFGSLPISIYVSREGGAWELLASELPNNGAYGWNVPLIDHAPYRLKITARDQVGNKSVAMSDIFLIASAPPETRILRVIPSVAAIGISEAPMRPDEPEHVSEPTPPPTGVSEAEMADLIEAATALRLRGDYQAAEVKLREATERDPHGTKARNELGALLSEMGRMEEAVSILRDARVVAPADTDILYNLGAAHYLLGRYDESIAAFETLSRMDPAGEGGLWSLAKAYYKAGDLDGARTVWQKIVSLNVPGSSFHLRAQRALASLSKPAIR